MVSPYSEPLPRLFEFIGEYNPLMFWQMFTSGFELAAQLESISIEHFIIHCGTFVFEVPA
jgi:hypothetical protein